MNDSGLRHAYDVLLGQRATTSDKPSVSLEQMRDVLERRGPEGVRLALLDRIMANRRHAEEFEILRAAFESSGTVTRRKTSPLVLAAAASLFAVVGLATWMQGRNSEGPVRGQASGIPLYAPAETALADSTRTFSWSGIAEATQYRFELNTRDGDALYTAFTTDSSLTLPDSVRLTPGTAYHWWVRAMTRDGELASALRPLLTRK